MVLHIVKYHGDASSLGYYKNELNCMSRTSICGVRVWGEERRMLGVLEGAGAVEVGSLEGKVFSLFYWKAAGQRDVEGRVGGGD